MKLGEKVSNTLKEVCEYVVKHLAGWIRPAFIESFKTEVAKASIDETVFQTEEVKKAIRELKEKWKGSPTRASEIGHDLMDIVVGKVSKVQLQSIAGIKIDQESPITQKLFNQIAIVTDLGLLSAILNITGEILSLGQIDKMGDEIRAYLDYSGLTQATGFGYGMILSSVLSPMLNQEIMKKTRKTLLSPEDAIRMRYKGIISNDECKEILSQQGFSDTDIEKLNKDYEFVPSPSDTISWLAREVFEPDMISKWGLDTGFENIKNREFFYNQGLSDDMIRNFWIAHWEHPDFYRIKTLLNRDILKSDDVTEWCKLQEIAPTWANQMEELMWNDLNRVDIRRIYNLGLRDDDWLRKQLRNAGYKGGNLDDMVSFYKASKVEGHRNLTLSIIIKGIKKHIISKDIAALRLVDLGYSKNDAEFIVAVELGASSPETPLEYEKLTQQYRKTVGLPYKKITKEMIDLEKEIIFQKAELKKLEEKKEYGTPYKIKMRGITTLEEKLKKLRSP